MSLTSLCSPAEPQNDLVNFAYTYDNVGNILSMEDYVEEENLAYGYDDLNRLVQVDAENTSGYVYRYEYSYERIGNITQVLEWTGGGQASHGDESIRVSLQDGYGMAAQHAASGGVDINLTDSDLT